jgi:hypothetical protein
MFHSAEAMEAFQAKQEKRTPVFADLLPLREGF